MRNYVFLTFVFITTLNICRATEFSGTVKSASGKPLSKALVVLSKTVYSVPLAQFPVNPDGTFRFNHTLNGEYVLRVAAVNHTSTTYSGFITSAVPEVDFSGTLATNIQTKAIKSVTVIGAFNSWNFEGATAMQANPDGTFSVELPSSNGKVEYQVLVNADSTTEELHSINGSQQDSSYYDGEGDFRSVVFSTKPKVRITFNANELPMASTPGVIAVTTPTQRKTDSLYKEPKMLFTRFRKEVAEAGTKTENESFAIIRSKFIEERPRIFANIQNETNPLHKQLYVAIYISAFQYDPIKAAEDSLFFANIFSLLPANSVVWKSVLGFYVSAWGNKNLDFVYSVIEEVNKQGTDVSESVSWAHYGLIRAAYYGKVKSVETKAYSRLQELYPNSDAAKSAVTGFSPNKKILVGKPLPTFSYASVDNPNEIISTESLRGKWVLIDLWATWCGPCVGEMPNLHAAYEALKAKNFEIVSISLDKDQTKIAPFREKRYKMPWKHIFSPGIFKSEAAALFEVTGIPKPILVDPNGTIVAISEELRGDMLLEKLRGYVK